MTKKERIQRRIVKELREWGGMFLFAIVAAIFLNSTIIVNATIPSGSMQETIQPGDRIFGSRLVYKKEEPERFDIIIFRYPDNPKKRFIKRIIGLPGETVNIVEGKVYINNSETPLDDSFIAEPMRGSFGPYEVPDDSYFVLGDNRNHSNDSRFWQNTFVPKESILGKAYFRYWPLTAAGVVK